MVPLSNSASGGDDYVNRTMTEFALDVPACRLWVTLCPSSSTSKTTATCRHCKKIPGLQDTHHSKYIVKGKRTNVHIMTNVAQ